MDNSNYSNDRHNEHLGVNKIGRNIKKNQLQRSNFVNSARQQPHPHPQVYKINKNDFRNIVQQLTGLPSQELHARPPQNSPSMRLQRIRPPPLTPINLNRPQMTTLPPHHPPRVSVPFNTNLARPTQYGQPPMTCGDHTAESPISCYMRYLQHSIIDSAQPQSQSHSQYEQHPQVQSQSQRQSSGLLPYPLVPSPRMNRPPPPLSPRMLAPPPPPLPSPTSQFLLPSPSGYLNLSSPRSPYPLLSPSYHHPPPLTPNFSFSPVSQPPLSPSMSFPPSPGFFTFPSPRWRRD